MVFHPLTVTAIRQETRDAVAVTLAPPAGVDFGFVPGQYLTLRAMFDGQELRRSYSICAGLDDGELAVGIKRVAGGAFSTWANEVLAVGDVIEAMPPQGRFGCTPAPGRPRHILAFAIGSGITPILSIIKTLLSRDTDARVTLVYGNRRMSNIMFREALEDLKNLHLGRFRLIHILKHDAQDIDLFTGRIDGQKCEDLFASCIDVASADQALICGPDAMMRTVSDALKAKGMAEDRIVYELFGAAQPGRLAKLPNVPDAPQAEATIRLDGAARQVDIAPGSLVLDAALAAGLDAPYSCRAGVCCTCRARVLEGEVEMDANHALEDYELRDGYVLTCQARAQTARLVIDYDG